MSRLHRRPPTDMRRALLAAGFWVALGAIAAAGDLQVKVQSAAGIPAPNVIVYATPKIPVAEAAAKTTIDQIDRQFVPRVSVVQAGTAVAFPNSDNIRHSVYSFSPPKVFTLKLYAGKPASPVVFDKPGIVVLGCNIHDNMLAWVLVVETPYFARTNANGVATLKNIAAGDYTLRAWREPMAAEQAGEAMHVDANAPSAVTLLLDLEPETMSHGDMQH
jgi:plastocyanin